MALFIHAADLHLDSPLKGLESYPGAPDITEIRGATRQALVNLVDLALEERVALVAIAGDLYDGDWPDFSTGLFFVQQMQRLAEAGIQVVIVRGNHDAANKMTKTLLMPENVKIFTARRPETFQYPDFGIAVHGQSYAVAETTQNLVLDYPDPLPGLINIGLVHCLISGAAGHQAYSPCTLDELAAKGYDYWALGHVHDFKVLREQPMIVYPGCCQGRHIKESGVKGCVLVTVDSGALSHEFVALSTVQWLSLSVDLKGADTMQAAIDRFARDLESALSGMAGPIFCVRVLLTGRTAIHGRLILHPEEISANIRAAAVEVSQQRAWIETVLVQTSTLQDLESLSRSDTPQGKLLRYMQELQTTGELSIDLTALKAKLAGSGIDVPAMDDPGLLQHAKEILVNLLLDADKGGSPV